MPVLFLLLILAYPVAEVMSLVWLTGQLGGLWTIVWLAGTFFLGALMLRHHKLALMLTLLADLRHGALTPRALLRVARYYLAAFLFMVPGPLSDALALLLLLPWPGAAELPKPADDGVLEGEYRRIHPEQDDKLIR